MSQQADDLRLQMALRKRNPKGGEDARICKLSTGCVCSARLSSCSSISAMRYSRSENLETAIVVGQDRPDTP